jgi:hypothetical protein
MVPATTASAPQAAALGPPGLWRTGTGDSGLACWKARHLDDDYLTSYFRLEGQKNTNIVFQNTLELLDYPN